MVDPHGRTDAFSRPRSGGEGGTPKFYQHDSANRLICIGSSLTNPCDKLKVDYDADGTRLREVDVVAGTTKLLNWSEIIKAAAASPLGAVSLVILSISALAIAFFRSAPVHIRFIVFML